MNLNQITVPSQDLVSSIAFYKKIGLHLIVEALPRYARFECMEGEATFSIHLVDELPAGHGVTIYFESENLDEEVARLQKEDIEFTELPNDKSWLWREARLYDPAGNHVILYYAGENRKNPPWRLEEEAKK